MAFNNVAASNGASSKLMDVRISFPGVGGTWTFDNFAVFDTPP